MEGRISMVTGVPFKVLLKPKRGSVKRGRGNKG